MIWRTHLLFVFFFCITIAHTYCQTYTIYGTIRDSVSKEVIPYAAVQIKGTTIGTSSNVKGEYVLNTQQNVVTLQFIFMGYRTQEITLSLKSPRTECNVFLNPNVIEMKEVVVNAKDNPAIRIIKKAIEHKSKNNAKIDRWQASSYSKVFIELDSLSARMIAAIQKPETKSERNKNKDNKTVYLDKKRDLNAFVLENISTTYFEKPNKYKEIVHATKVSGSKESFSMLPSFDLLQTNFYQNNVEVIGLSLVSPIADGALWYYNYELEGSFYQNGRKMYKINFEPITNTGPTFKGTVFIDADTYALQYIDVVNPGVINVNFVTGFHVRQQYTLVDSLWLVSESISDFDFDISLGILTVKGRANSLARFKDYQFPAQMQKRFFNNELMRFEKESMNKDSVYWQKNRQVELADIERKAYKKADSIQKVQDSLSRSPDSLKYKNKRFSISAGGSEGTSEQGIQTNLNPLVIHFKYGSIGLDLENTDFNAVEGYSMGLFWRTSESFSKKLNLSAFSRWGFADEKAKWNIKAEYSLSKKYRLKMYAQHRFDCVMIGNEKMMNKNINALYSMIAKLNYAKYNYVFDYQWGISTRFPNGIKGKIEMNYQSFHNAVNNTEYGWVRNRNYMPNLAIPEFEQCVLHTQWQLVFAQPYITSPKGRINVGESKYPKIRVNFWYAIPKVIRSNVEYAHTQVQILDEVNLKRWGKGTWKVTAGKIIGNHLPYPLLMIFSGNQTIAYNEHFNVMRYYEFIADEYATFYYDHDFGGLFFNRIPWINRYKLRNVAGFRIVSGSVQMQHLQKAMGRDVYFDQTQFLPIQSPFREPYMEAGVGITNLFKVLRIDMWWRLNYHQPNTRNWNICGTLTFKL
ncbi:MAG: DUF5686 and carboxypeptidase regulatory-like domain-containing protein [Bacteroidia bacterium]|nr:DUF5686 and carboxypeptidase regulatory-like domain-containing protein [Bacteroidia bacterium]MDW8302166.1 DUF5686 and carboxypeptidase regulatory-like domain-containing protein [Bacteroidia bacterium]